MAKPSKHITPENRVERWKKLWSTPRKLSTEDTEAAFDEFQDALVPSHMHKLFLKSFGQPKASFGNRFFTDGAVFQKWETRFSVLGAEGTHLEATVIYGSPDALEAHTFRGETRRCLKDVVIDDWHAACAIVRSATRTFYVFVEPKMRGCIVLTVKGATELEDVPEDEPIFIEHDEDPME